jgi:hypothetical protein
MPALFDVRYVPIADMRVLRSRDIIVSKHNLVRRCRGHAKLASPRRVIMSVISSSSTRRSFLATAAAAGAFSLLSEHLAAAGD